MFAFRVKTPKAELILSAQTEAERVQWMTAIEAAGRWWNSSNFDASFREIGQIAAQAEALPTDIVHFDEDATQRPDNAGSDDESERK